MAASDPGLGVQTIKLTSQTPDGANPSRTVAPGCGTRVFECPNQASATFRYADLHLPDGTSTLSVRATDPIAHTSAPTSWQVRADSSAPTLSVAGRLHDAAGHFLDSNDYPLQVSAADGDATHPNSGVKSIEIQVDGQRKDYVEQSCDASCPLSRSFTLHPADYAEGNHTVSAIATDTVGHQTRQSWQVKVDRTPPALTLSGELTNHAGEWLGGDSYGLTGAASDAGGGMKSIEVQVDGQRADYVEQPCDAGGCSLSHDFTYLTDRYGDGQHAVTVIATDQAGNQTQQAVTAKVDRTVPTFSLSGTLKDAEGQQLTADSYGLSVNAFDGDAAAHQGSGVKSIELQVDGQRADYVSQPCDAGSCPLFHDFTLDPAEYRFGSHTIRVIVTDQAGRTAESSWQVSVPDNPADAPPRAPHLSGTATTSLYDASRFLYAGPNAVQTGADPAAITPVRAAVLRGKVTSSDGQPLGGVHLTVVDHPEYGSTLTRANGEFYMAVNGGGRLRVRYERDGYLPSERWVDVAWQDYAFADDVVLVPIDGNVTDVQLGTQQPGGSPLGQIQVARGGVVTDSNGSRQATLMFKPGTTAQMTLPDGTTQPLSDLHVRATEYTVGQSGPAAMPGELPANSAYTYAADYSVDEALA
ncbi:MAG: hypothetical protein E6G53_06375, partial [Actinobacteria bacterium]